MKTVIEYKGRSHVRSISSEEIKAAFNIEHESIVVETRSSRQVTVAPDLAEALVKTDEWRLVSMIDDDFPQPVAEAPEEPSDVDESE